MKNKIEKEVLKEIGKKVKMYSRDEIRTNILIKDAIKLTQQKTAQAILWDVLNLPEFSLNINVKDWKKLKKKWGCK